MTNLIPQAAIEAACEAYRSPKRMITNTSEGAHHDRMTAALEAAMPHLRKQIATEIRAEVIGLTGPLTFLEGVEHAARIAEGLSK